MKKNIFLTLAAVAAFALATQLTACKGNKTESTEQKDSTAVTATPNDSAKTAAPAEENPATEEKK